MKIGIIHLSDIHFHKGSFDRDADKKTAERICAAVKTELIGSTHVLLIVSGDIAFSGLEEEYQYALDWFSELYTLVDDACEATCWILCAPGNHDVDLTENRPIRAALISQISKNPTFCTDEGIIYECTKEQTAFFNFRSEVESDKVLVSDDPLLRIHRIRGGVNEVQINILNSAWMSSLDQTPHSIIYPIDRYSEQFRTSKGFVITVLHHPLSWFEVENSRKLCHEISQSSSVVFCGHEHMPASTRILTSFGDHVKFLDGGVLNSHDPLRRSSFNLLLLDADACKLKDFKFEQIGDRYKSKRETDWQDATRLATAESRQFRLRKQVRSEIEGVGINIIHPRRDQLLLRDLFIYPDLLPIDEKESAAYKRLERTVSSERLVFESGSSHVILEGDEKTGKTALLRMLFSDFYGRGKIPLYVLGSKINTRDDRSIRESLRRAFERTYEGVDFTRYEQIGSSDRVILLDDFGQLEKNLRAHQLILEFLRQFSDKVIITTRDPLPLEWLTSGEKRSAVFQKYNSYVIQKFGHVKRNELIERWLFLDRQNEEITSILDERNHARQVIDTTIGQNFVPPSPIFVLVILQSIETASSSNVGSTYGHYYQFLIVQSLMHSGIRPEDLDAVSNFISELAYNAFFLNKTRRISEDTFVCFHQKFRSEYGIDWNLGRIRYMLQKGNIIAIEAAGSITFKYRYIFYFYLAKRLSRGLSENDICGTVRHMCNRLHVTEYANVILFLIHHSDDKFVLDSLQTAASLLMQEQRSFEFEAGDKLLEMVNQLPSPTPIGLQLLEDRDPEKEQKRALKNQDVIEAETEEIEEHISDEMAFEHEPMDALDILAQAGVAAKTVDLLGQVLKNYYGSLRIDTKVAIGKDAVELALRALFSFIDFFISEDFRIVNAFMEVERDYETKNLKQSARKDEEKLRRWARDCVFALLHVLTRSVIQRVAGVFGSDQLKLTLSRLVSENDLIGYRMVEIAVLLDSPSQIPRKPIELLTRRLQNNALGFQVLRDLAAQRVYQYPMKVEDKQWLVEKLGFSMAGQRKAELQKSRRILSN